MPFPEEIITFPTMQDITASDGELIKQFQDAIQNEDMESAMAILVQIPNYDKKILTANYFNLITQTLYQLQGYYLNYYSPSAIVSTTQPAEQAPTDFWFEITGTNT